MKRFNTGFIYLGITAILILALSAPASPSAASIHATLIESIQQQINEIVAAIARIQIRILELMAEEAQLKKNDVVELVEIPEPINTNEEAVSTATDPVWKFVSLPSTYLAQPLAILYRFSITGGAADTIIPSVTYTVTLADVSIKDLEIYAYSDELFSIQAFLRSTATKRNRVGRQIGYLNAEKNTVTILFDQGPPSVAISAGETYYFELRGTVVAKNKGAFVTIAVEGLSEIKLE